jgi:hypothetical protein
MPFTFPDPSVTDIFTGDNGITYVWDAVDSKWQIKGFAVEQREDFDPQLKGHVCAEFFEVVANHETVEATKGHSMATYNFGVDQGVKYWTKPPKADFFVNGESYYINEAGPFEIGTVDAGKKWVTFFIKGGPTPAVGDSCTFSKTRKLCTEIVAIHNDMVELEEEIDAIAPASERGKWKFFESGTITGPGIFTTYDQPADTSGNATGLVQNIKSVWLHSTDLDGGLHSFDNVEIGNLLELFVQESDDYALFEVVKVGSYSSGTHWIIDVNFIRTLSPTTKFDQDEIARLKIFQAPEGGAADDYVLADFSAYPEVTS